MNILITGNMGYVGPVLVRHLRTRYPNATLLGYDNGYFAHCLTGASRWPECRLDEQFHGDVRRVPDSILKSVDAVVLLAAVSNDPMGSRFEAVTGQINDLAAQDITRRAISMGVRRVVFASSCSLYGAAQGKPRNESDTVGPLTAYARSKWACEQALSGLAKDGTVITSLRFATACGMSDRLRLDLVLNDFVAAALTSGCITVLSDGSPWRPLIEVRDMARAIEWALFRHVTEEAPSYLAVNTGSNRWNHQVRDLAAAVAHALPGTQVHINTAAPPDKRSYQVDFSLFERLAPQHQPQIELDDAISGLVAGLRAMEFSDTDFHKSSLIRLKTLERHIATGALDHQLQWRQEDNPQ